MNNLLLIFLLIVGIFTNQILGEESSSKTLKFFRWYYSTNEYALNGLSNTIIIWKKINEFKKLNQERLDFESLTYSTFIDGQTEESNNLQHEISEENINNLKRNYSMMIYNYYFDIVRSEKDIKHHYLLEGSIKNIKSIYRDEYFIKKILEVESDLIEKFDSISELENAYDYIFKKLYDGSSLNDYF